MVISVLPDFRRAAPGTPSLSWPDGWNCRGGGSARPPATGPATAVTAALAAATTAQDAARLYLRVTEANPPARPLYARAGFTEHHGCHHRVAPPAG